MVDVIVFWACCESIYYQAFSLIQSLSLSQDIEEMQ